MRSEERLEQRLAAVERAVVDGDVALDDLEAVADLSSAVDRIESRLETYGRRTATLEGRLDALGGFVGNVESANDDVERQANGAIAAVDRLEYRIDELERRLASEVIGERGDLTYAETDLPDAVADTESRTIDTDSETSPERNNSVPWSEANSAPPTESTDAGGGPSPERSASDLLSISDDSDGDLFEPSETSADGEESVTNGIGLLPALRSKLP